MSGDPTTALTLERDFLLQLLELTHHDDPGALLGEALRTVVDLSGADHGFIELFSPDQRPEHGARFSATRGALDVVAVRRLLSSTIMRAALAQGHAISTRAAHEDMRFTDAPSVREQRIDAVVCVPIGARSDAGVLYLQGTRDGQAFPPDIVRLCELFARHLVPIAAHLMRRALSDRSDPTAALRERLRGSDAVIGRSHALATALKAAANAAPRDIGVLITGPSGSGKTALARLIAANGPRASGPFVEVNCANLQHNLIESELFGAMPGAHSTATRRIHGKVEAADRGTLFLDEVAELDAVAQAKLLQFCHDRTFYPLGGTRVQRADVRLIAATNANLAERVAQGSFREDLFYRLCVIEIRVPPLDERRLDIAPLAEHFLREAISRLALPSLTWSHRALRALETAEWPGNVRQLRNTVEAAAIRALGDDFAVIEPSHAFPDRPATEPPPTFHALMRGYQRQILVDALGHRHWNVSDTAAALGLGRSSLYQLMDKLGIERP